MTLLASIRFSPKRRDSLVAPMTLDNDDVTVVVPVKDNQPGVERFLAAMENLPASALPLEVIFVDNNSDVPLRLPQCRNPRTPPVRVIPCRTPGPAAARNAGARHAAGAWLLFTDSDCVPTETFVSGYASAMNGSIGYAGRVSPCGDDALSRYYDSQDILIPPHTHESRPQHLITANALVWREAFERVGGFDERFPLAAGEDIDLGFRLSEVGRLCYAFESAVRHDFSDGLVGFARRFYRYGRGNCQLARRLATDLSPRPFRPAKRTCFNYVAAWIQFGAMFLGYRAEGKRGSGFDSSWGAKPSTPDGSRSQAPDPLFRQAPV